MKNTNEKTQVNLGTSEKGVNVVAVANNDDEKTLFDLFATANNSIDKNLIGRVGKAQYIEVTKMLLAKQGVVGVKDMDYYKAKAIHIMAYISGNSIAEIPKGIISDLNRKDEDAMTTLELFASLIELKENITK